MIPLYRSLPALLVGLLLCLPVMATMAATANTWPTTPRLKDDGSRWRIAYVESGVYNEYPLTLRAVIAGLQQLGWVDLDEPMPHDQPAEALWQWLSAHDSGGYIEFVEDAYWRPGNFEADQRAPMREQIEERVRTKQDLDLLMAMGTWAGQDMRAIGPPLPTVVMSVSDAVSSGVVDSVQDSGRDLLHARVEPNRYQRQLHLFHDIVPFVSLGVVYENSEAGRSYAAVDAIREMSATLGFNIAHCHAQSSNIPAEQAVTNAVECYRKLAEDQVDASYVTTHQGVTSESITTIADILRKEGIASFSMQGAADVRKGILLSLAQANVRSVGLFHAEVIARIFNGAQPRALDQVWIDPAKIALNLDTARVIGFDPPIDILLAADDVYQ